LEHIWKECRRWRERDEGWQEVVREILGEEREGEWWMKEVLREREMGRGNGEVREKGCEEE